MKRLALFVPLLALAAIVVFGVARQRPAHPFPTEHRLDSDAERVNRKGRKAWIQEMHRAAPGVDWRAIERANGLALQEYRRHLPREESAWTELGSRNQAGRMHAATLASSGDSLYAGSSLGGVWKGSLGGEGWRPLSDNLYGGSHGLAVAAGPPEVITSVTDDGLVSYSDDGGASWTSPAGLPDNMSKAIRVARDMGTDNRIYLMVAAGGTGVELFRSEDGGRSYSLAYHLSSTVGDFWIDRVDGGDIYVLNRQHLFVSQNQGMLWQAVGDVVDTGYVSDVVLTGSEAGAPAFYAALNMNGSWRLHGSDDGGHTWDERYAIGDFWKTLTASIADADLVLFAGVENFRSTNGGHGFTRVNAWGDYYSDPLNKLHADNPGLDAVWVPGQGEIFYPATDGGLYRSDDGMATVTNISMEGLGVSQYYSTLTSIHDPYRIQAGAQDQGYQVSTGQRSPVMNFEQVISGDYARLTSSDGSHEIVYSVYPGFLLINYHENYTNLRYDDFPPNESYPWLPFILADPDDERTVLFCGRRVHAGYWPGGSYNISWTPVSSTLFNVDGAGYVTALSIASSDHDRWALVTDNGRLWYSEDHGATWIQSADQGPSGHFFHGSSLLHHAIDPDRLWVGGSGYSGAGVWKSEDGGVSWTPLADGLPSTMVLDLCAESPGSDVIYAATEAGPYRLEPLSETWQYIGGREAPLTTFWCVEAVPSAGLVRFGTYGRGIWDYATGAATAAGEAPPMAAKLDNWPNPFNPQTTIRFLLDQAGPARLRVFDAAGRRLATLLDENLEAGEHELSWKGRDGAGRELSSGVYFLRLESGGQVESLPVTLLR